MATKVFADNMPVAGKSRVAKCFMAFISIDSNEILCMAKKSNFSNSRLVFCINTMATHERKFPLFTNWCHEKMSLITFFNFVQ